jgi:alpha-glucosidase (family GH31 glycosyl hydrolase)
VRGPLAPAALAALALVAAPAPPAGAAVEIGPERIVVSTPGARALIDRAPLRMAFDRGRGGVVLRQVANARSAPVPLARTQDPEPFSLEREPDNAVYAPLTFEVGEEERAQWTGVYWAGNMLFSRRSGTVYSAQDVVSATRAGDGVEIVASTSDPSGRQLLVTVAPDRRGSIRVQVRPTVADGVISMADSFASPRREAFRGFGGRHQGVNQRGRKLYGWVEEENFGGPSTLAQSALLPGLTELGTGIRFEDLGVPPIDLDRLPGGRDHYLFPGGPGGAYYVQSSFVSSRGYGFLLNRDELSRWRMANDRRDAWQVQASAPVLDYTVAPGGQRRAIRTLTGIGGRHRLPPRWAHGAIISRAITNDGSETPETYRAKIEADLRQIERRRPPVRAYAFEGWGVLDPAYVRQTIARVHRLKLRAILYVRAYVSNDFLLTQPPGDPEEVVRRGLVVTDAQGQPAVFRAGPQNDEAMLLDFTNPDTRSWWRDRLDLMLSLGADGFMQDFGEQTLDGMRFRDGSNGAQMHNRYPVLYHRATARLLPALEREHGRDVYWFTRAGYSGRPGSAAYEQSNFPGDETVDWSEASGLASLTPDMLNRAVGGAFGYSTDVGGYASLFAGSTTPELFTRWSQWAALSPFHRVHNSAQTAPRMPWSFDRRTYRRWRRSVVLHDRATRLLRRLWRTGRRTGIPPTRPLWLAHPGDRRAARQDQQWLLGPNVLVAPVVVEGARSRRVYFPRGCWRSPATGRRYRGRRSARVPAPLGALPYFFRCGTRPFRAP